MSQSSIEPTPENDADRPGEGKSGSETPASGRTPAAALEVKKPSFFRRIFKRSSGSNKRVSRGLVLGFRFLVLAVIFFLLGMLLVALRWYRPTLADLSALSVQSTAQAADLQQARQKAQQVDQQVQSVQTTSDQAQGRLGIELARIQLMQAELDISDAQVTLAQNDAASAKLAVAKARTDLKDLLPQIQTLDDKQVANINAVFTLIDNDLSGNPQIALQDLARMRSELELVDKNMLQNQPELWKCSCSK